jgi:RimJ/RimL family protein N-acetyltransferase
MLGPVLETERLLLRPPISADFEPYCAFMALDAARFIGGPQTRPVAWRGFATMIGSWTLSGFSMFSIIEKATGRWVGRGGPWSPEGWPGTEIGWAIIPDSQRRGYAFEASIAAIDWAFEALDWDSVIHCIDPANLPSIALARALGSGLQRVGVPAPAPISAVTWNIYGQTREAWSAWRNAAGRPPRALRIDDAESRR